MSTTHGFSTLEYKTNKIYLGISDFNDYFLVDYGEFYPKRLRSPFSLIKHYSNTFNCVYLRFVENFYMYLTKLCNNTPDDFKFVIQFPGEYVNKINTLDGCWDFFWKMCRPAYKKSKLGLITIANYEKFESIEKLEKWVEPLSKDIRIGFIFYDKSWYVDEVYNWFTGKDSWCIVTCFVENCLFNKGWAGNISSTRTQKESRRETIVTGKFNVILLSGTLGKNRGSYDKDRFLEKLIHLTQEIDNEVYILFDNFVQESTYRNPLPTASFLVGSTLIIGFNPSINDLSEENDVDRPCNLHDALKFRKLWTDYEVDREGYLEIEK